VILRLLDISFSRREVGASIGSFLWDDDSFYSLLGIYHQREISVTAIYILFMGIAIDWRGNLEDED
jgi:hypothetical protein